jgi:hypothetical protein
LYINNEGAAISKNVPQLQKMLNILSSIFIDLTGNRADRAVIIPGLPPKKSLSSTNPGNQG